MEYGRELGKGFTLESLLADGFKAVYLALGAHQSKRLEVPGEDVAGVLAGMRFLKAHNLHGQELASGRVGIIGGGNSAMDAARVACRQKAVTAVTVFYRRSQLEMPAYQEEIQAALAEGIAIQELVAPVALLAKEGRLSGFKLSKWGTLAINSESFATGTPGVFAGGDVVSGPSTVIGAIAAGKQAAVMINHYVRGHLLKTLPKAILPSFYIPPAGDLDEDAPPTARVHPAELAVAKRAKSFAEVELAISEQQACCEAKRCLRCDLEFTQPD